ncbi:MAG: hypothetical protein IPG21_14405 [Saprospiraceae bacterium]|nr:hypothetical protein [Candidatus Vicinibacter affinis]
MSEEDSDGGGDPKKKHQKLPHVLHQVARQHQHLNQVISQRKTLIVILKDL